ncbi:UDP-glucose 4-epimerase GalE [Escherichia coli]|uniref:UDP-glucose 4-epimerase GalE n=1 Tax=Escherichia coli TaxID=562 RepID=UPI00092AEA96|nr:UDP-glucose 4-epimerase GalE [Escherichia coli]OJS43220.1 UDP-glucose 4-epimerase GalE [Escherichia coli]
MKVLVTGGAGYIGSHVVSLLIEKGYEVVVYDNLCAGHRSAVHSSAFFVEGDLMDENALAHLFHSNTRSDLPPFDGILHFASHIQVGESMREPFKYLRDNVGAVTNLLEQTTLHKVKRFILSSTANLYDAPQRIPIAEDEALIPGSIYGETKYIAERYLGWMDKIYGLRYCCLRYFNASGAHPDGHIGEAHDPETHLIPIMLQVALGQRDKLTVYGDDYDTPDGTCIRDYVHVMDLADAHILALEALKDDRSRVYNLGSGQGFSVLQVLEAARAVTEHDIPTEFGVRRAGDLARLVADSTRIKAELGWQPQYDDLRKIVETEWNWHKNHPHGYEG